MIRTRLALKLMWCTTWLVARLAPWLPRAETCAEGWNVWGRTANERRQKRDQPRRAVKGEAAEKAAYYGKIDGRLEAYGVLARAVKLMREMGLSKSEIAAIFRFSADAISAGRDTWVLDFGLRGFATGSISPGQSRPGWG
jgi:hypothetical protein